MAEKNSGFLLIDKEPGPTSHDIVNRLRAITGEKKIGHAGTLDPFASGLLIVAVGRPATRKLSVLSKKEKSYEADIFFGATTDTMDRTGRIISENPDHILSEGKINEALKLFEGESLQLPPMFSAKKIKGKKLYEYARKGIEIDREPVKISITKLCLLSYSPPVAKIEVECSSGTYVRVLAHDIGKSLGAGAYLKELARTRINGFLLKNARKLKDFGQGNWRTFLLPLTIADDNNV